MDANAVKEVCLRALVRGLDLDKYRGATIASWGGSTRGFKFYLKNGVESYVDFVSELKARGSHFASESDFGHWKQGGYAFREISDGESLHIILRFASPDDKAPKAWYASIHIDSVSVTSKRDKSGRCKYDYTKLPKHIWKDLWRM
jgi:hypothetical protein